MILNKCSPAKCIAMARFEIQTVLNFSNQIIDKNILTGLTAAKALKVLRVTEFLKAATISFPTRNVQYLSPEGLLSRESRSANQTHSGTRVAPFLVVFTNYRQVADKIFKEREFTELCSVSRK
jgi:hypothetical protein